MSRNMERARAAFEAFNRDGAEALFDLLDSSIEWSADRGDAGRVTSYGIDAVKRSFTEQFEAVSNLQFEVAEMQGGGRPHSCSWSPERPFPGPTGIEGGIPFAMVLTIGPDGKLVRVRVSFRDTQEALEGGRFGTGFPVRARNLCDVRFCASVRWRWTNRAKGEERASWALRLSGGRRASRHVAGLVLVVLAAAAAALALPGKRVGARRACLLLVRSGSGLLGRTHVPAGQCRPPARSHRVFDGPGLGERGPPRGIR